MTTVNGMGGEGSHVDGLQVYIVVGQKALLPTCVNSDRGWHMFCLWRMFHHSTVKPLRINVTCRSLMHGS